MDFDLSKFVVADKYGNDPLKDKLFANLNNVTSFIEHTVTPGEDQNPQLISDFYYETVELYRVILAYNGIANSFDIVSGMTIRIPDPAQVLAFANRRQSNKKVSI